MAATPLRWLPRSFSSRADPPSPFSSNPAHEPVSTPSTPAASFGCMAPTATDSPPDTPKDAVAKPKPAPAVMSAAAFVAFLSPRRLMQRAARAFRSSRSRRRMKFDEPLAALPPVHNTTSRLSEAASAGGSVDVEHGSSDGGSNNNNNVATVDKVQDHDNEEETNNNEPVPEKIIHEMMTNHHPSPPTQVVKEAEACEKTAADEKENHVVDDEPKKAAAVVVPAREDEAVVDVADKFCMVVKEAMMVKKHEEEYKAADDTDTKKEAMRAFQQIGSRVKTAMEARTESEHPRCREVARSNDMIEEACTKLLAKRQGSRVRALVGAFETVMEPKPAAVPAAGKPRHHYNYSV